MLTYKIADLLHKPEGTKETHAFDEKADFVDDQRYVPLSTLRGTVAFMRLAHEINVQVSNVTVTIQYHCSRCLKKYRTELVISFAEREFITDLPQHAVGIDEDVFYVDMKRRTLDIQEMLRQEILLHFPENAVCYDGCKGLCYQCGKDLNEGACSCERITVDEKPLYQLKGMVNS